MPPSCRRKQPTSSAAPNRFLIPRTMRSAELRSPSKCSTTSTRCSSERGPAMAPSLVTWPTRIVATPVVLAADVSAVVTARTWLTPPVTPSASVLDMVCTESTTTSVGCTTSMWPSTACRSDSAARKTSSWLQAVRSARIRICPRDSWPDTYNARRPDCAHWWATCSSNVDLPTPGSPASNVTEPGTTPPPSTRSSSSTPVGQCRALRGSIELIGTAAEAGATERRALPLTADSIATSSTVPQVPHSAQRPTHLAVTWWHSEQRYCERALATDRRYPPGTTSGPKDAGP